MHNLILIDTIMELPHDIWCEIVKESKKQAMEVLDEIDDLKTLENAKKLIDKKIFKCYCNLAKQYNKFDILYDNREYWIITEVPNFKLCNVRRVVKTNKSGVFGKFNIVEENSENVVKGVFNLVDCTINSNEVYSVSKANFNLLKESNSIYTRKCKVIQSIKDLEKIRVNYANSLKPFDMFKYNYISTADYRQVHYFNHESTAIDHVRTARVYYTTDKYIYINCRIRINKRFVIEE